MTNTPSPEWPANHQVLSKLVASHVMSMEAICALSAALTGPSHGTRPSPSIERALYEVLAAMGLGELAGPSVSDESRALATVLRGRLAEAFELSADPGRDPGWRPTIRDVMEGQALISEALGAVVVESVVPTLPGLAGRLASPGASFLDVGVGAAGLAMVFCGRWRTLTATGIDIWEPALALARERILAAGLEDRIELRRQDIRDLGDRQVFDLAWIPVNFIAENALRDAAARTCVASRPGAWIILSMPHGSDALSSALARLGAVRAGGATISVQQAASLLTLTGCEDVRAITQGVPPSVRLVAGRLPVDS